VDALLATSKSFRVVDKVRSLDLVSLQASRRGVGKAALSALMAEGAEENGRQQRAEQAEPSIKMAKEDAPARAPKEAGDGDNADIERVEEGAAATRLTPALSMHDVALRAAIAAAEAVVAASPTRPADDS